jgi:hypothetical protein
MTGLCIHGVTVLRALPVPVPNVQRAVLWFCNFVKITQPCRNLLTDVRWALIGNDRENLCVLSCM